MKKLAGIAILGIIFLISSCSMNWDSGGTEEYKGHCENSLDNYSRWEEIEISTIDIDNTCACMLKETKIKYPNYTDYLGNMKTDEDLISSCLVLK